MAPPRKHLPPNGREIIQESGRNGLGEKMIAQALGLSYATWRRMKVENPEVRELWEEAKASEEDELVGLVMQAARGAPAEYDGQGNVTRAERPPYVPAAFFLLKTRHAYREMGEPNGPSAAAAVQIIMPAQIPLDQLRSMVPGAQIAPPAPPNPPVHR